MKKMWISALICSIAFYGFSQSPKKVSVRKSSDNGLLLSMVKDIQYAVQQNEMRQQKQNNKQFVPVDSIFIEGLSVSMPIDSLYKYNLNDFESIDIKIPKDKERKVIIVLCPKKGFVLNP